MIKNVHNFGNEMNMNLKHNQNDYQSFLPSNKNNFQIYSFILLRILMFNKDNYVISKSYSDFHSDICFK
jgi:hypothetical protein